ncbi:hypothetical protein F5B20DRAFT_80891 [Whalleya microplaca]|nr:hypothetical protein F5B20DRAFT_80891 [Whalleya microplaca]
MSTISRSSTGSRPMSRGYDTGFPDSFAARTTSLRHPDAIVTPGACISAEDVDPSKTSERTRRSFLGKHKWRVNHGKINSSSDRGQPNASVTVLPSIDSAVDVGDTKSPGTTGSLGGSSKDGAESIDGSINGDYLSTHMSHEDDPSGDARLKSKLFRKWRSQKE